jgi:signal transduction histidine kinase
VSRTRKRVEFVGVVAIAVLLIGWCVLLTHFDNSLLVHAEMATLARSIATWSFMSAGILGAATWRLSGDRERAQSAITMLVIGIALALSSAIGPLMQYGRTAHLEGMTARIILVVPLLILTVLRARRDGGLARLSAVVFVTVAVTLPAALASLAGAAPPDVSHPERWLALEAITVAVWATMAAQTMAAHTTAAHTTAARPRRGVGTNGTRAPGWVTAALLMMAAADSLKAWTMIDARAITNLDSGFQVAAAMVAMATATVNLSSTLRRDSAQSGALLRALVEARREFERFEKAHRALLHDARSAVVGVVGASQLLAGSRAGVDTARIRELVVQELNRLRALLDTEQEEPIAEFDVAEALGPVVLAHQVEGTPLVADWSDVRAAGRPHATATAVDNLLRNVRQHAPDARAWVTVRRHGDEVAICVHDNGGGIPSDERRSVLLPGVRGSTSRGTGSGLGLYSAARSMTAQGGSLRIEERDGGGTTVLLLLPAAATVPDALTAMAS